VKKAVRAGRKAGSPNYKAALVVKAVRKVLPVGSEGWKMVAFVYREESGEDEMRDHEDLKKYFMTKCCNGGKKPTGKSAPSKLQESGLQVWALILKKEASVSLGCGSSDSEGDDEDDDVEDEEDEEEEEEPDVDVADEYERFQEHELLCDQGYSSTTHLAGQSSSSSQSSSSQSSSSALAATTPSVSFQLPPTAPRVAPSKPPIVTPHPAQKRKYDGDTTDTKSKNARPAPSI
jgi:hypothetical protein